MPHERAALRAWSRALLAGAAGLVVVGCGGSSAPSTESTGCATAAEPTDAAAVDAAAADVQAVMTRSCALGGCHLSAPGAGNLVLSFPSPAGLRALVGRASQEDPSMDLVRAGHPEASWLVHKIDGDLCGYTCAASVGCGVAMPFGSALDANDRAAVVSWIAGGAVD